MSCPASVFIGLEGSQDVSRKVLQQDDEFLVFVLKSLHSRVAKNAILLVRLIPDRFERPSCAFLRHDSEKLL